MSNKKNKMAANFDAEHRSTQAEVEAERPARLSRGQRRAGHDALLLDGVTDSAVIHVEQVADLAGAMRDVPLKLSGAMRAIEKRARAMGIDSSTKLGDMPTNSINDKTKTNSSEVNQDEESLVPAIWVRPLPDEVVVNNISDTAPSSTASDVSAEHEPEPIEPPTPAIVINPVTSGRAGAESDVAAYDENHIRLPDLSSPLEIASYVRKALLAQATGDEALANSIMNAVNLSAESFKKLKRHELIGNGLDQELATKDANEFVNKLLGELLSAKVSDREKTQYLAVKAAREAMDQAQTEYEALFNQVAQSQDFITPQQAKELKTLWGEYVGRSIEYAKRDQVLLQMLGSDTNRNQKKSNEDETKTFFDPDWEAPDIDRPRINTEAKTRLNKSKEPLSDKEITVEEIESAIVYRTVLDQTLARLAKAQTAEEREFIVAELAHIKATQYSDLGSIDGDKLNDLVSKSTKESKDADHQPKSRDELRGSLLEAVQSNRSKRMFFEHVFVDILKTYNTNNTVVSDDSTPELKAEARVEVASSTQTLLIKLKELTGIEWPDDIKTIDSIANSVKAELNREAGLKAHQTCENREPRRKSTTGDIARVAISDLIGNGMQALTGFWPLSLGDTWIAWREAEKANSQQSARESLVTEAMGGPDSRIVQSWDDHIESIRRYRARLLIGNSKDWALTA